MNKRDIQTSGVTLPGIERRRAHVVIIGDADAYREALDTALVEHNPAYIANPQARTRITMLLQDAGKPHNPRTWEMLRDFLFKYQELFDNSWWRVMEPGGDKPNVSRHKPKYNGIRKDFVDVEWEFVMGHISDPAFQKKLQLWAGDAGRKLSIRLCFDDAVRNKEYAERLRRRLPASVNVEICRRAPAAEAERRKMFTGLAKYLNYFYQVCFEQQAVPTELPEAEVEKAWEALDPTLRKSSIYNVMSIPHKMALLGHEPEDWDTFIALTAAEIEELTEIEHNRWSVERLIQGSRPCTSAEEQEIEEDMRRRIADPQYTRENPVSLKKLYKKERNAHYDLRAYSELGVDETGLPVTRYDRDLTAAIPLIVKTYSDRHNG